MNQAPPIILVVVLMFLSSSIVAVVPVSASTQEFQSASIVAWGPTSGVVNQDSSLYVRVMIDGNPASAQVSFTMNGKPVVNINSGSEIGYVFTDNTGVAQVTPWHWGEAGTYIFKASAFVKVLGQTVEKSWTCVVSDKGSAATPTAAPTAAPTATATPQATVPKSTLTPTSAPQATTIINVYVPPTTVINQVIPGTVTQGTGPWENPRVTVKNPGPDKLRTTILDFAKNPEENTAHYDEQVKAANADGWTLSARGEKTYGDASKDYRYSRFTKGTSTLLFAAQGNNSTEKNYDIPGDVLITETEETFAASATTSIGSLLGLPGFEAVYAVAGLLAVAYVVMRHRK